MILNIINIEHDEYASTGEYEKHKRHIAEMREFLEKFAIEEQYIPKDEYAEKAAGEWDPSTAWYGKLATKDFMVDDAKLCRMLGHAGTKNFRITVKTQYDSQTPINREQDGIVKAMRDVLNRMENTEFVRNSSFNEKCEVHVGGFALMIIDEVMLAEDCCTDALQRHLNDGWRMLSVNVQPDQRRPDYILGRKKADNGSTPDGAERG